MKKIKALIFDLDHCLYPDPADKDELYFQGAVKAALRLGLFTDFESASCAVRQSVADHKSEIQGLIHTHKADRDDMFRLYHEESLPLFLRTVKPVRGLAECLAQAVREQELAVAVLTHSAREWAVPFIDHLGLSDVISPERVFALNDPAINHRKKSTCREPFLHACKALNVLPEAVGMLDDQVSNLAIPSQLGMTTVRICWTEQVFKTEKPAHVHHHALDAKHFIDGYFAPGHKTIDARPFDMV